MDANLMVLVSKLGLDSTGLLMFRPDLTSIQLNKT